LQQIGCKEAFLEFVGKINPLDVRTTKIKVTLTVRIKGKRQAVAFAMALIEREMPVNRVAEILGVYPQRGWTVFNHWLEKARKADDPSSITRLGVDETASRKGHKYATLGVDLETSCVIPVGEGKGKSTLIGLASFTSSNHELQMEYWKVSIAKSRLQKDAPEASVISRISST